MELSTLPWFDIVVLGIVLISALVGFVRGAVREMVTALAFGLAAVAAIYALPFSGPVGRGLIDPDWAGTVIAIAVVFVAAYATLRITGGALAKSLQDIQVLGLLDRAVGLGFGLIRALVVLGAFYLVFHAATPPDRVPRWMKESMSYPMTAAAGRTLQAIAPKGLDMAGKLRPGLQDAIRDGTATDGGDSSGSGSYDPAQRGELDDLVEKSR